MFRLGIFIDIRNPKNIQNQGVYRNCVELLNNYPHKSIMVATYENVAKYLPDVNQRYIFLPNRHLNRSSWLVKLIKKWEFLYFSVYVIEQIFYKILKSLNTKDINNCDVLIVPFPTWMGYDAHFRYKKIYIHVPDIEGVSAILGSWSKCFLPFFFASKDNRLYWVTSFSFRETLVKKYANIFNLKNTIVIKHHPYKQYISIRQNSEKIISQSYIFYPAAYRNRKNQKKLAELLDNLLVKYSLKLVFTCYEHELNIENNNIIYLGQVSTEIYYRLLKDSLFNISFATQEASLPYVCFDSTLVSNVAFCIQNSIYNEDTFGDTSYYLLNNFSNLENVIIECGKNKEKILKSQRKIFDRYSEAYKDDFNLFDKINETHTLDL